MKRITTLAGISAVAAFSASDVYAATGKITSNEFNPAISLVLDGRYTDISEGEFALPGFQIAIATHKRRILVKASQMKLTWKWIQ